MAETRLRWQSRSMQPHLLPKHQNRIQVLNPTRKTVEPTKKRNPTSNDKGEATMKWYEENNYDKIKS